MGSFVIRTDKSSGTAKLYTTIRKSNLALRINTLIEVDVAEWIKAHPNKSSEDISKYSNKYRDTPEGERVASQMKDVGTIINEEMERSDIKVGDSYNTELIKERIMNRINKYIIQPLKEKEQVIDEKEQEERRNARRNDVLRFLYCHVAYLAGFKVEDNEQCDTLCKEVAMKGKNPNEYLELLASKCKNGMVELNANKKVAFATFKNWHCFITFFSEFFKGHSFVWDGLDASVVDDFVRYLNEKRLMSQTKDVRITLFKSLCKEARKKNLHNQDVAMAFADWSKGSEKEEKKTQIYLTLEELDALYNMTDLTEKEELRRDIFLIGCYTCQRVSDYSRINKDMIKETKSGVKYIELTQKKTKTEVQIPLRIFGNDNLVNLLEKYDYTLHCGSGVATDIDHTIKRLAKRISGTCPSLAEKIHATKVASDKFTESAPEDAEFDSQGRLLVPRYELISSHTARRSGITNMFKMGKYSDRLIMKVSGHRSMKVFEEYIRVSGKEIADIIDGLSHTDINDLI